ncbi:MAG: hypothetical protein LC130_17030 [Bryobacterales bacterium]|nr:hypothetical protein [Bryobacterales bacterium]MCZ2288579.1 hypothetical protein [Anaerolineales bacterium]
MNVFERTAAALAQLGIPYALDVYLTAGGAELPATFCIYSLVYGEPVAHYDNDEAAREYVMQVSCFSTAGLNALPDVDGAMKAAGFRKGTERQLPRDAETRHFGMATDYHYTE